MLHIDGAQKLPMKRAGRKKRLRCLSVLGALAVASLHVGAAPNAVGAPARESCVVIDNDFDIDDMMAIPLVVGNEYVAAIVQSEGYTLPEAGAAAIDQLVNQLPDRPGQRKIPVVVGGKQSSTPDLSRWSWLPFFRSMMNQADALLPTVPTPSATDGDYAMKVARSVENCRSVSLLLLGTYTSFVNYSPLIRQKIDRVVIMGQPIGDDSATEGRESFNCNYDRAACETAMIQLQGLKAYFVDVPRDDVVGGVCRDTLAPSPNCYNPSYEMVVGRDGQGGLLDSGLPGRLKQALTRDLDCDDKFTIDPDLTKTMPRPEFLGTGYSSCTALSVWVPANVSAGPGGEMLMWDQAAALFLVHPDRFGLYYPVSDPARGGKHYEPTLVNGSHAETAEMLRQLWTEATNQG